MQHMLNNITTEIFLQNQYKNKIKFYKMPKPGDRRNFNTQ